MISESVEALGPEVAEGFQPSVEDGELAGFEPIESPLAVGPHAHETRLPQQFEMFGHAGLAKARRRHQLARRPFSGAEQIEHLTAARLGNGFKRAHIIIFSYRNITANAFISQLV